MFASVRMYRGNSELADQLAARSDEVRQAIGVVPGFRAYYMVRGENDTATVTVCDGPEGAEESNRRAAAWLRENMPDLAMSPPEICAGEVVMEMAGTRV
jgi:hypothetical protein